MTAAVPLPFRKYLYPEAPGRLTVRGRVGRKPYRFHLNLVADHAESMDNIALHVSVRCDKGTIVFNSVVGGKWKNEEVWKGRMPFVPDSNFELIVYVSENNYEVSAYGQYLHTFRERQPHTYSSVNTLHLEDATPAAQGPGFVVTHVGFEVRMD